MSDYLDPRKTAWIFLFLILALLFQGAYVGLPRGDHFWLMGERAFAASDWDYFVRLLSFNRTRVLSPGDYDLFRPAATGLLALVDIAGRENFFLPGILSLLFHLACVSVVFVVTYRVTESPGAAFCLSLVHGVQYAGLTAVTWRHISPYLLACAIAGLLLWLLTIEDRRPRYGVAVAGVCFAGMLFHEWIALAAILYVGLSGLEAVRSGRPIGKAVLNSHTALFLLPLFGYLALNLVSRVVYSPPFEPPALWSGRGLRDLGELLAFVLGGYFFPFLLSLRTQSGDVLYYNIESLDARHGFRVALYVAATALLLGLSRWAWRVRREPADESIVGRRAVHWWAALSLSWFVGVYGGRGLARGFPYLKYASYYFYFSNFLIGLGLALYLGRHPRLLASPRFRRWGAMAMAGWLALTIPCLVSTLYEFNRTEKILARSALAVGEYFSERRDLCLAAIDSPSLARALPEVAFWRYSCRARGGEPARLLDSGAVDVFLVLTETGKERDVLSLPELHLASPRYAAVPKLKPH